MIIGYLLGALTMLIGVMVGHLTGKPWLDRQFARVVPKPTTTPAPTTKGTTV